MKWNMLPKSYYVEKNKPCLWDKFYEQQKRLPPKERKNYAHMSCPCSKCNTASL